VSHEVSISDQNLASSNDLNLFGMGEEYKLWNLSLWCCLYPQASFSLSQNLLAFYLNIPSPFNVKGWFPHPYKTTRNTAVPKTFMKLTGR
jgi:hypothetical protein